ncbi:MAG: hypothetical protein HC809_05620 [Gammaproteobacteria bacterium]|nr:hypothetical protein [Gammaproteobacteria bacterium]
MTDIATCPVHQISPLLPENLSNPYVMNARLRREAPVHKDPLSGIYFISRYADVVALAQDHQTFSSVMPGTSTRAVNSEDPEILAIMAEGYPNVATMLTQDPPLQRRYRKFVDGAFSPANLKRLEPFIESTSHALIDRFAERGHRANSSRSSVCRCPSPSSPRRLAHPCRICRNCAAGPRHSSAT